MVIFSIVLHITQQIKAATEQYGAAVKSVRHQVMRAAGTW
jgi:hypothetical protein